MSVTIEGKRIGIPGEKSKKFGQFFTSKAIGKGTGLGLCISAAITKSHGCDLNVWSLAGKGTKAIVIAYRSLNTWEGRAKGKNGGSL